MSLSAETSSPKKQNPIKEFIKNNVREAIDSVTATVPIQTEFRRLVPETLSFMAVRGKHLATMPIWKLALLCFGGGVYMCIGGFLGTAFSAEIEAQGIANALLAVGFITGFSFSMITGSFLFTEANLVIPVAVFKYPRLVLRLLVVWFFAYFGNILGAIFMASLLNLAMCTVNKDILARMSEIARLKLIYADYGNASSWWAAFFAGSIGNIILATGSIVASQGKLNLEKVLGPLFGVFAFIGVYSQNSIANVCLLSVSLLYQNIYRQDLGVGLTWERVISWNIIPCTLGNTFGGSIFGIVYVLVNSERKPPEKIEKILEKLDPKEKAVTLADLQNVIKQTMSFSNLKNEIRKSLALGSNAGIERELKEILKVENEIVKEIKEDLGVPQSDALKDSVENSVVESTIDEKVDMVNDDKVE